MTERQDRREQLWADVYARAYSIFVGSPGRHFGFATREEACADAASKALAEFDRAFGAHDDSEPRPKRYFVWDIASAVGTIRLCDAGSGHAIAAVQLKSDGWRAYYPEGNPTPPPSFGSCREALDYVDARVKADHLQNEVVIRTGRAV